MNATLSTRQLRLVVILGMFVLLVGGFLVVERGRSTKSSTPPATSTPAVSTPARTTPAPSTTHTHTATPTTLKTHGLPVSVARALQKHSVVVVSLTTPRGADAQFASAEAKAGAAEAKAGYVAINVFHQRPGTTILRKLGVTSTPVTLVVKRSGAVVSDFPGFVDRDVVAQAVTEAR
jgi:thiol:disulfide interchange protein